MNIIRRILSISKRECGIIRRNPIYWFCMVVFPVLVTVFFTSMMNSGQPQKMPVGVVDLDQTATTRTMIRRMETFQTTDVVAHYNNVNQARNAIQRGRIYAFLYIPKGMTEQLMSSRQPTLSFYVTETTLVSGALLYRDMKTLCMLASASVSQKTMAARGYSDEAIMAFLQPITIDVHALGNPWMNYSVYLNNMLIPCVLMLFIFLITAYSLGTELKFGRSKEWLALAKGNIHVALVGKFLPQTVMFIIVMTAYNIYIYGVLGFPLAGSTADIVLLTLLSVFAAQGLGIFFFGLMPNLRMAMSICSLWGVLSFSTSGTAFPAYAMDAPLNALTLLFPIRHYYTYYQLCIFNGYPIGYAWTSVGALLVFICLPLPLLGRLKKAMLEYEYIP